MILLCAALIAALALSLLERGPGAERSTGSAGGTAGGRPTVAPTRAGVDGGADALLLAEARRRSDVVLEVRAPVARLLRDDRDGSPHQRFVIDVADSITVLVAHNLELAPRVPLEVGDTVVVRGEYEWSAKGGVLHWTHDDPAGRHPGGWVELDGRRYE